MLTIGANPGPFHGRLGVMQRNALLSWLQIDPTPEILLFGEALGTAEVAQKFGLRHLPDPLPDGIDDAIDRIRSNANSTLVTMLPPDLMLIADDLLVKLNDMDLPSRPQLLIARSWLLQIIRPIDVTRHWQPVLRGALADHGRLIADRRHDILLLPKSNRLTVGESSVIGDVSVRLTAVRQRLPDRPGIELDAPSSVLTMTGWRSRLRLMYRLDRLRRPSPMALASEPEAISGGTNNGHDVDQLFGAETSSLPSLGTMRHAPSDQPLFTVVVCTYNRADLLPACLESLCRQRLDQRRFEIVVVNNNSTDRTDEVVGRFVASNSSVRLVFEPNQGLSHARNRGWREAKGRYVAYVDDEICPPANWLCHAERLIEEINPDLFGGPYFGKIEKGAAPPWLRPPYFSAWQGRQRLFLEPGQYISGGNLFIRRSLFAEVGDFDHRLGMRGNALGYGEETDFQMRLREQRPHGRIIYEPALLVEQMIRLEKTRPDQIIQSRIASGISAELMKPAVTGQRLFKTCLDLITATISSINALTFSSATRSRLLYPYVQNYWMEGGLTDLQQLGRVWARLRYQSPADSHNERRERADAL